MAKVKDTKKEKTQTKSGGNVKLGNNKSTKKKTSIGTSRNSRKNNKVASREKKMGK